MIATLANLPAHPESVPINMLVQVEGTPLATARARSIRSSSCAPSPSRASPCRKSVVRLSAGREDMSEETQALCFLAGANSIFYGPKLLTTANPEPRPRHAAAGQARAARRWARVHSGAFDDAFRKHISSTPSLTPAIKSRKHASIVRWILTRSRSAPIPRRIFTW